MDSWSLVKEEAIVGEEDKGVWWIFHRYILATQDITA